MKLMTVDMDHVTHLEDPLKDFSCQRGSDDPLPLVFETVRLSVSL